MPRKKVNPVEEPEQVNDTELESQVTEDAVEGLEQPPADIPPEDVSPPTVDEEAPLPEPPPEDMDTPRSSSLRRARTPDRTGKRPSKLSRRLWRNLWMSRRNPPP